MTTEASGKPTGTAIAKAITRQRADEQRDPVQTEHHDPGRPRRDGSTTGEKHVARLRPDAEPVDPLAPPAR